MIDFVLRLQVHMSSLLHGLAMQHLRGDWDLCNLVPHDYAGPPPPNVRMACWFLKNCWKSEFRK